MEWQLEDSALRKWWTAHAQEAGPADFRLLATKAINHFMRKCGRLGQVSPTFALFHFLFAIQIRPQLPTKKGTTWRFEVVLPERRGRKLALTVLYVPYSLDSGPSNAFPETTREGGGERSAVPQEP